MLKDMDKMEILSLFFEMMSLHSSVLPTHWNYGKSHYPLVITWFGYCWRSFSTLCSQLNLYMIEGRLGSKAFGCWLCWFMIEGSFGPQVCVLTSTHGAHS
jgi:hypothetical protein